MSQSIYVPKGVNVKSLSVDAIWSFVPHSNIKVITRKNDWLHG